MALSDKENWLRTVRMTNPEFMPYAIHLSPSTWACLGQELEDIVLRHPKTWPNFRKGSYDWKNPKLADNADPEHDFVDSWQCVWRTTVAGNVGTVVKPALADWAALGSCVPPDPATYNGGFHSVGWEKIRQRMARLKAEGKLAGGGLDHGYFLLRLEYLRGFENLACDLAEDNEEIRRLADRVHGLNRTAVQNWIDAGAEVIHLPEDLGSQKGSLIGPRLFRKWVTPFHKELHDMVRNAGRMTYFHCDGNIMDVADQIREIHPDVFNPQDRANGVENLAQAFKGRLCIALDFDRQWTMPFGTPREIRELLEYEVRTLGSRNGGLMISAEVRGQFPPENIESLASALEAFSMFWFE